jgi:hypothetical protein
MSADGRLSRKKLRLICAWTGIEPDYGWADSPWWFFRKAGTGLYYRLNWATGELKRVPLGEPKLPPPT